jgi:hypothetical protein
MAHFDNILEDLKRVSREIAEFMGTRSERRSDDYLSEPAIRPESDESPLMLTETLTVWQLTMTALQALNESRKVAGDVVDSVEQQPFLHHQIRLREKTVGFARSYLANRAPANEEESKRVVFHVSDDPSYSSMLTKAFMQIDGNEIIDVVVAADPLVRLLEIPSFQFYGLWLFSEELHESRILVISAAERYKTLTPGALLNSEDFFSSLQMGGPLIDVI